MRATRCAGKSGRRLSDRPRAKGRDASRRGSGRRSARSRAFWGANAPSSPTRCAPRPPVVCCCSRAAVVALVWANSPWQDSYHHLRDAQLGPLTVEAWASDGALTLFFYLAGVELKRELVVGTLSKLSEAVVPVVAAIAGMVLPAIIYLVVNLTADNGRPQRLGGADGNGYRVRPRRAGDRRVVAAQCAAGVPAHAGGGRRLRRDPGDRGVLLARLPPAPPARRGRPDRGLVPAAAPPDPYAVPVRSGRDRRVVVHARVGDPRDDRRGRARAGHPGGAGSG